MTDAPSAPGVRIPDAGGAPRLPRPPGVIRQFWARHPWLTDSVIAVLYLLPTFIGSVAGDPADVPPGWIIALRLGAVAIAGAAILLLRRRQPWLLIFVAWGVCLVVFPFGVVDTFPILLALYALAVYRSTKAAWLGFAGSVAVGTLASYLDVWAQDLDAAGGPDTVASASQHTVLMLIATLIGVTVGNRRRYVDALIARAHDLVRERDQQAQLAAALERSRIAREMHDIVSHGLTVMVTLASGSAAVAERDPARAAETMERVAETGRTALSDMRRMLGVLAAGPDGSDAPAGLAPMPGTAAIPGLVETFRAAGLPARLITAGPLVRDPNLELTVYRVVQEGLTNVLRHAGRPSRVDVIIEQSEGVVEIRVTDDGSGLADVADAADAAGDVHRIRPEDASGGRGLVGMRERVLLYGGSFAAGALPRGGWELRARLPAPGRPTTDTDEPTSRGDDR